MKKSVRNQTDREYIDTQLKSFKRSYKSVIERKNKEVKHTTEVAKNLKRDFKQAEKEILFLTSITGEDKKEILGLQHHIGIATSTIDNHLMVLKNKLQKGKQISNDDLINTIQKISMQTQKIASIVKFVTKANYELMTEKIKKDLVSFIKQYIENVYVQYEDIVVDHHNVNIIVDIENDFEFIYEFKPLEIVIVIDNLINNSIKANASDVELKINKLDENAIELRFKDNGKGIQPEYIDKIFDFGFTTTDGSGIGLYHIYQIVKNINGTIEVNRSLDKGAEFIVTVLK